MGEEFRKFVFGGIKVLFFMALPILAAFYADSLFFWSIFISFLVTMAGFLLNCTVIIANHGKMPIVAESERYLDPFHVKITRSTHLKFLSDIFLNKDHEIKSLGDYMVDTGIFLYIIFLLSNIVFRLVWHALN